MFDPEVLQILGLNLLAGKSPNFAENLGNAGLATMQYQRQQEEDKYRKEEREFMKQQREMQLADMKRQQRMQQAQEDLFQRFVQPGQAPLPYNDTLGSQPPQPNIPGAPPSFDMAGYRAALPSIGPQGLEQALKLDQLVQKDNPFGKIDPKDYTPESIREFAMTRDASKLVPVRKSEFVHGVAVDAYKTPPGTYIPNPEAMLVPDGRGGMRVNQPLVDAKAAIAAAGRPSVSVTTGNTMASELGKGTGELLTAGRGAAESAASTISMSNTIRAALDSGKVISGPGANVRLGVAQIANTLGLPVDDTGLKQTRVAIAGMANQALNARGSLKGQGQVSDFEGKLLERAKSGDISMTLPELQAFLDVNERLARAQIEKHNSLVSTLAKNPAYSEIIPFYSIEQPAPYQRTQPAENISPAEAAAELERRRRLRGGG